MNKHVLIGNWDLDHNVILKFTFIYYNKESGIIVFNINACPIQVYIHVRSFWYSLYVFDTHINMWVIWLSRTSGL